MSVLERGADRRFHQRAARYIRLRYASLLPDICDFTLNRMVAAGIARARSHGFQSERTVIAFLDLMFSIAPNFDDVAGIRARLDRSGRTAEARLEDVIANTRYRDWQQACRSYDPGAWGIPFSDDPSVFEVRGSIVGL